MREQAIPILRSDDATKSAAWYANLGFSLEWEHRFEPGFPLFVSLVRGDSRIFVSEHKGDARPGGLLYLRIKDVESCAKALDARATRSGWGTLEFEATDPDRNRVRVGWPSKEPTS